MANILQEAFERNFAARMEPRDARLEDAKGELVDDIRVERMKVIRSEYTANADWWSHQKERLTTEVTVTKPVLDKDGKPTGETMSYTERRVLPEDQAEYDMLRDGFNAIAKGLQARANRFERQANGG